MQLSALQSQLRTVENTEKMKLLAELADAQAKLANADFGKFERDLRDSNDGWLMKWNGFYIGVLAVIGVAMWFSVKSLIANRVEKSLSGFKKGLAQVDTLKNEVEAQIGKIRILDKEHAAEMLARFMDYPLSNEDSHPEEIKALLEEAILDVLRDGTRNLFIRIRASEILTHRGSHQLASPAFELLNSILNSHQDKEVELYTASDLCRLVNILGQTPTQETYEGLTKFLNRLLLRKYKEYKDLLLAATTSVIAQVSRELNKGDWVSPLKRSFSDLGNEPETIKETLKRLDGNSGVDDLKDYLLELLEQHDPQFVSHWRERRAANTETKETS